MRMLSHGCTLDCFDCCKFNVYVEDEKIVKLEGDKNHPYTKGIICSKGKKHLERLRHKDRILNPLKKVNEKWVAIDFEEALAIISEKLLHYREKYGSNTVLHYSESGSGGVLKAIEDVFFNFYGGITLPQGSTCWGAGITAQKYDFGDVRGHQLDDMFNAKCVVLWGRNPANTSLHLMNMLKEAKKSGSKIIVIDPIHTGTADLADIYVQVNPAADGALAMAMTKVIIEDGLLDRDFISKYVKGFEEYAAYLNSLAPEYLAEETGIGHETIRQLAHIYSGEMPAAIYPGYGLQKYKNGGNTVRTIDALAAITGNIGRKGGGVNYANRVYPGLLNFDPYNSGKYAKNQRYFDVAGFSDFIEKENNPPIKVLFVSKANPLAQFPNLNKAVEAFGKVEFKVCIDMFMTDTAACCNLFIPCTNTLETEDMVYTSMGNPYITYNEKAVEPADRLMDEYYFFQELAQKMELKNYPVVSKREYLEKVTEPLKGKGFDLDKIKQGGVTVQQESAAWSSLDFKTPSGKIEIYSEKAKVDGLSPMPVYVRGDIKEGVRLISSHHRDSIFSQHFLDVEGAAQAYINPDLAKKHNIRAGDRVILKSCNGEIEVQVRLSEKVPNNIVHMYTGWWQKHGNPNFLTANFSSDMGGQVAYHETFVEIEKDNQHLCAMRMEQIYR